MALFPQNRWLTHDEAVEIVMEVLHLNRDDAEKELAEMKREAKAAGIEMFKEVWKH